MKIESAEHLRDLFSIFHDGSILSHQLEGSDLLLHVEIRYLAERVSPELRAFSVRLFAVSQLHFSPWPIDAAVAPAALTEVASIFAGELEILSCETQDEVIDVTCNQRAPELPYGGGSLRFRCAGAEVTDERGHCHSIEELTAVAKGYWEDFSRRQQP